MIDYKFSEDRLLKELKEYVDSTYEGHYATDKYQATDIIIDAGYGMGFLLGNVIKYAKRYGKKGDVSDYKKDLMKILHYALIALHEHERKHEIDPNVIKQVENILPDISMPDAFESLYASVPETEPSIYEQLYPGQAAKFVPMGVSNEFKRLNDATAEEWNAVHYNNMMARQGKDLTDKE